MTELTPADFLHTLRVEAARLAGIDIDHLPLSLPHIEGWTVHNVVGHTGWVYRWVALIADSDEDNPPERADVPEPPAGADVLPWFEESARIGLEALERTDPDRIVSTFTGLQPMSWWQRRVAHETSMHRWDAEAAIATPDPIDADIARDGIDELLQIFVPARLQFDQLKGTGETIHLHATDIEEGEWVLTLQPDRVDWEHAHVKADVAARGPVSDLLLLLWSRLPPSRLDTFGDASLLDRWQHAAKF
jgi:uncharacterized protein (TIGR03083 family)